MKKIWLLIVLGIVALIIIGVAIFFLIKGNSRKESSTAETSSVKGDGILYLGFMSHLEGWNDDQSQERYLAHAQAVKDYANLFEKYGGKITFESKEFTDGEIKWGGTVLKDMEKRGHGIGVHADVGGETIEMNNFVNLIKESKIKLESLGITIKHISGVCSRSDWVTAASQAGYKFITGGVAFCTQSLPVDKRPTEYTNCQNPAACHQVFPTELKDRIHPWRMSNGNNWLENDPNGKVVFIPSSGLLQCMAEYKTSSQSIIKCSFEEDDIDASIKELEAAIELTDKNATNTYYLANSLGEELDNSLLEKWLVRVKTLIDQGKVQWKTTPQMYDEFVAKEG